MSNRQYPIYDPTSLIEDYIFPTKAQTKGSNVQTLPLVPTATKTKLKAKRPMGDMPASAPKAAPMPVIKVGNNPVDLKQMYKSRIVSIKKCLYTAEAKKEPTHWYRLELKKMQEALARIIENEKKKQE